MTEALGTILTAPNAPIHQREEPTLVMEQQDLLYAEKDIMMGPTDQALLPAAGIPFPIPTIVWETARDMFLFHSASSKHSQGEARDDPGAMRRQNRSFRRAILLCIGLLTAGYGSFFLRKALHRRRSSHTSVGLSESSSRRLNPREMVGKQSNVTLRDFLQDQEGVHLALAPAFFGFYGYFGALAAWYDQDLTSIRSTAGASAGAMVAIALAAAMDPRQFSAYASTLTVGQFADPWGALGAVFRGIKFEQAMYSFLKEYASNFRDELHLATFPVAVTAFDLLSLSTIILTNGSMARAARASATFPFLFQPVGWKEDRAVEHLLMDGGIGDPAGVVGLKATPGARKRIVNMSVGTFWGGRPPTPFELEKLDIDAIEVVSITLQGLPACGPWALEKGPLAIEAARVAMNEGLDMKLIHGTEVGHYFLNLHAATRN